MIWRRYDDSHDDCLDRYTSDVRALVAVGRASSAGKAVVQRAAETPCAGLESGMMLVFLPRLPGVSPSPNGCWIAYHASHAPCIRQDAAGGFDNVP